MSRPQHSTVKEDYRLASKQDGWNLPAGTVVNRTRNAGSGRPNLRLAKRDSNDSSTDDSEYDDEDVSSSEDLEEEQFEDDLDIEDDGDNKPPASRLIIEVAALKKIMEDNCQCPECKGPVEMKVNTICIASNVILCCLDEECGFIDHSDLPASAKVEEEVDDRHDRITDYAVNVLYVLGFITCGDGGTEAARMLGLLGLPNDTTSKRDPSHLLRRGLVPSYRLYRNVFFWRI
jgi:hypothetical protein